MQAWLVSMELINDKIIKKGWEGQRIFKSFKIEGQEEDTLQKIQKEN